MADGRVPRAVIQAERPSRQLIVCEIISIRGDTAASAAAIKPARSDTTAPASAVSGRATPVGRSAGPRPSAISTVIASSSHSGFAPRRVRRSVVATARIAGSASAVLAAAIRRPTPGDAHVLCSNGDLHAIDDVPVE